jgi:repressor LexA
LRLVGLAPKTFEVEVEGYIAAGQPLGLADGLDIELELTPDIADPRKDLFALEVQGDSMVDDLVGDGDILVVERRQEALRGQMAVVHLRDRNEATLKRFYPEGRLVRLQPAHPTLEPIYVDAQDVEIQGRVVAVIRRV